MIIRRNMASLRTFRESGRTQTALTKNLEKLSSGLQINRAGDDAAGLAISEKMRAEITEMNRCQNNVTEGLDLARTADGALEEINDMLCRARGLCVEAANGTYSEQEKAAISDELNQLFSEIDRITASSKHNSIPLFRGDISEHYHDVYDEIYNELGPSQVEKWGTMEFVQEKEFDPAQPAIPAKAAFKLDADIDLNKCETLEGKSITIDRSVYYFTSNPDQALSSSSTYHVIDLTNYTSAKTALEALGAYSGIEKISVDDADRTVTVEASLSNLIAPVYADGKTTNYNIPGGDGESKNGTSIQNTAGNQILQQVDGKGVTNNLPVYSSSEGSFSLSNITGPLTADQAKYLNENTFYIVVNYSAYSVKLKDFTQGMSKDDAGAKLADLVSAYLNGSASIDGAAVYNSSSGSLDVTLTKPGGPVYAYMYEYKPSNSSKTEYDPNGAWTSASLGVTVQQKSPATAETGAVIQITIPQVPSSPFSFQLGSTDHLYYNKNTNPLTTPGYPSTSYSYPGSSRTNHETSAIGNVQGDVINRVTAYVKGLSGVSDVTVSGNVITVQGWPGQTPSVPVSGSQVTVKPYKSTQTSSDPHEYVLSSNGSSSYFAQEVKVSFELPNNINDLAGRGFSLDGNSYRFEFVSGSGAGLDGNYTDIDLQKCATASDLANEVQTKLGSNYSVITDNSKLVITATRNAYSPYKVSDGTEGIVDGDAVAFSGGANVGHSQTTLDFSSINADNLDTLLGKGFRIHCATCEGEYINVFFCWENDGTMPEKFSRLDESTGEMRTIHNIPVELSKVTSGDKIVESIVNQVRPSLTHYTDVAIGDPPTTLIAMEKRVGKVEFNGVSYLGHIESGMETNFTYSVEYVRKPDLPEDGSVKLYTADVQIYAGSTPETQYIPVHLPYIDLEWLRLNPPDTVDLNAEGQDAADWLARVDRANIAISDARGTLGADYNRLERAFKALAEADEQLTDAESRIRDADMANLMMENTKLQILSQSQRSILAQANAQPQQILKLLA